MRAGNWLREDAMQLTGKTLGLIGFGGIAAEVARIAIGSGMRVTAWNRSPKKYPKVEFVELDELLTESDVISIHLLLNDETRGLVSRACIEAMKPGVILVNTARGAIVDEEAMIDALKSGQIRHAGLDVFNTEPLPADHPLTKLPNVTLSAHSAFRTPEASENLIRGCVGALPADCEGRIAREMGFASLKQFYNCLEELGQRAFALRSTARSCAGRAPAAKLHSDPCIHTRQMASALRGQGSTRP